jgi:predicted DNA-binding transcriptional regulator AlpA
MRHRISYERPRFDKAGVMDRTGFDAAKLNRAMSEEGFPRPSVVDDQAIWDASEVEDWMAKRWLARRHVVIG